MSRKLSIQRRGIAIALALIVLPVVLVLGFGLATLGIQNLNNADAERYSKMALFAAEAGVNQGILRVLQDPAFDGNFSYDLANNGTRADVTVYNGGGNPPNGAQVQPNQIYIYSNGTSKAGAFARQVGVMMVVADGGALFPYAAFGHQFVEFKGTADTDSFNSKEGTYAQTKQDSDGNIGTNGTNSGNVTLNGAVNVRGNVDTGKGSDPNAVITGGGQFQSSQALSKPVPFPAVDIPGGVEPDDNNPSLTVKKSQTLNPGTYGDVSVTAQGNITLQPGVYVFRTLDLTGQGKITVNGGPVEIYIVGDGQDGSIDLDLGGGSGLNNNTKSAPDCIIYCGENVSNVKLRGNSSAYFAVYAPEGDAELVGTSDLFGSVIADTVSVTGTPFIHYDRALMDMDNGPGTPEIKSWQRM